MGQSQVTRAHGDVDTVITNVVVLDHWGIVKADVGIKDARIFAIGKTGNPDIQPNVDIIMGYRSDDRGGDAFPMNLALRRQGRCFAASWS